MTAPTDRLRELCDHIAAHAQRLAALNGSGRLEPAAIADSVALLTGIQETLRMQADKMSERTNHLGECGEK